MNPSSAVSRPPRRSPAPGERQVDGERTKAALVDAALEEFAAKGYAGTGVREVAERAGVSKDLIAYHFGSKEGLYRAVQRAWVARQDAFADTTKSLAANLGRYLHEVLSDPRPMRLLTWRGLSLGSSGAPELADDVYPRLEHLARRIESGELDAGLDPAVLQLALLGAVAAPVVFPDSVHRLFGKSPDDPAFEARYRAGLLRLFHIPDETGLAEGTGERAGI